MWRSSWWNWPEVKSTEVLKRLSNYLPAKDVSLDFFNYLPNLAIEDKPNPDNIDEICAFGGWWQFYQHLPLITLDEAVVGKKNLLWQEYVSHDTYGEYWKQISSLNRLERITIPVYIHAGWYDNYPGACFKAFQILRSVGASDEIRIHVDPTDHPGNIVGDRDFGPSADWPGPGPGGLGT